MKAPIKNSSHLWSASEICSQGIGLYQKILVLVVRLELFRRFSNMDVTCIFANVGM